MSHDPYQTVYDPPRLLDTAASDFTRATLKAGWYTGPTVGREARVLAALGVTGAVSATSKSAWALMATWKKAVVATAIASAGAGGAVVLKRTMAQQPREPAAIASARSAHQEVNSSAEAATHPVPPADVNAPVSKQQSAPSVGTMRTKAVKRPSAARGAAENRDRAAATIPAAGGSLPAELKLLDQARIALREGRLASAEAYLNKYERRYANGALRPEAAALTRKVAEQRIARPERD